MIFVTNSYFISFYYIIMKTAIKREEIFTPFTIDGIKRLFLVENAFKNVSSRYLQNAFFSL